jgi:hypothetical protein
MAGVVAAAGAGFHRMSLKKHKKIVKGGKRSEKGVAKKPMITASDEHRHGSLRPRRRPDACCCCLPWSFLGVLVLKGKPWIGKGLESRGLGEKIGAPEFLFMGLEKRSWHISQEIWEVERLSQPNRRRVVWDSS